MDLARAHLWPAASDAPDATREVAKEFALAGCRAGGADPQTAEANAQSRCANEWLALPSPMLIETHAHLDYPDFASDFDDVLKRATEAGVTRILTIGTSIESSRRAVELAEKHDNIHAVIGVHPSNAEEAPEDVMTPLRELAKSPLPEIKGPK